MLETLKRGGEEEGVITGAGGGGVVSLLLLVVVRLEDEEEEEEEANLNMIINECLFTCLFVVSETINNKKRSRQVFSNLMIFNEKITDKYKFNYQSVCNNFN